MYIISNKGFIAPFVNQRPIRSAEIVHHRAISILFYKKNPLFSAKNKGTESKDS